MASPVAGVTPVVWYDVDAGGSSTQITDNSGNAVAALSFAAGSNSPVWVDYAAVGPGVRLAGAVGSRISQSANTTLLDAAAEVDTRVAVIMPDWTPASTMLLFAKGGSSAATGWGSFQVLSSGVLRVIVSDGVTLTSYDSTAATGFTDGTLQGVRFTYKDSTDELKFFTKSVSAATAYADIASNTGWTQLGTTRTATRQYGSLNTSMGIGSYSSGSNPSSDGTHFLAVTVATTIDGSPVLAFDAALAGGSGYTDSVSGLTWTIVRPTSGRKTVVQSPAANAARSVVLGGLDDWLDGPTTAVPSATSGSACTLAAVIRPWATQAVGKIIATTRATTTAKGVSIEMAGTSSVRAVVSDGTTTVTSASVTVTLGRRTVVGAILTGGSPGTVRVFAADSSGVTLGATSNRTGNDETGGDLRCFADQSGGNVIDVESECPWISFNTALTSAQLDTIFRYYDSATASKLLKAYYGGQWVLVSASRYSGTEWISMPTTYWNGTAWV